MAEKLKVVARTGRGKLIVLEEDIPQVKPGHVLIDVYDSLVSPGTHLRGGWRALAREKETPRPLDSPQPLGYSNAGVVLETDNGVTKVKVGERVMAIGIGYALHATLALVPQNLVFPLPDNVSFEQGAYGILAATALNALRRGGPTFGENIAAVGAGIVGQLSAQFYQLAGCYVIAWDLIEKRLDIAREWGVSATCLVGEEDPVDKSRVFSEGYGLDGAVVAIHGEANEAQDQIEQSLKKAPDGHPMGTVVIVGGTQFFFRATLTNVDYRRASRTGPGCHDLEWEAGKDYPPVFVRWTTRTNMLLCLRLISEGRLNVDCLTTHRVPIDDCEAEIDRLIEDPDSMLGVLFKMKK